MNYDCRPVRQNYGAQLLCVTLFACAGVSFALGGMMDHAILYQVLGLCFVMPAIQLIARYMVSRYLYRLHVQEDGTAQLEIFVWRGGAKMQLVFCADTAQITAITPLTGDNARPPKGCRRHNFAQDLRPQKATVLSVCEGACVCEVLFCPDEGLVRLLRERISATQRS